MNNVTEAATRLREYASHNQSGQPYSDWEYQDGCTDSESRIDDAELIIESYLAEHPADDQYDITPEWLEQIDESLRTSCLRIERPDETWNWMAMFEGVHLRDVSTKGEVRLLFRALTDRELEECDE